MRTLLVEDDARHREMFGRWLTELGLHVTAVDDGQAGLLAHLRQPFDLLVIDWVTPTLDGLALCQRIRQLNCGDRPYILMVTSRDRESDLQRVLEAGADDYIAKPVEGPLLKTRIRIAKRRLQSDAEHRQAREALAQSEADFRRVIERCPLGVFAERDGEVVYANAAALRIIRAPSEDLIGRRVMDFVSEPYRKIVLRRRLRFERTKVPSQPMEMELRRHDGTVAIVRLTPATWAQYRGRRASFTILEDITQREQADRELRMMQFAIDHAVDAAFWLHPDGRIAYANRAAAALSGRSQTQLVGADVEVLVGDKRELMLGGTRSAVEGSLQRCDGTHVPVEVTASALQYQHSKFVLAFVRDLTERKRLQNSLHKADRLASVGALAAGVAHEINNPLAYVIANLELLAEATGPTAATPLPADDLALRLTHAIEGAQRVRRIVGDLKSFAREDEEEASAVDIHEVLETAIDIATNEIRHRARLVRDYGEVPPTAANAGRLSQVFLNLLVNAAHAIGEEAPGDHTITVRTRAVAPDWVAVEIADTGSGIAPEIVDHIFDPFFTTKPQGVGTGLGLSICHGIIARLGGEISVRSGRGGTTFCLRLPAATTAKTVAPSHRAPAPTLRGEGLRILVVDDEPMICEGIRLALARHDVTVAPSGEDAIALCDGADFDLILCDVMMPGTSGIEVFGRIGASRPTLKNRFVFMTGGAFTPKAQAFLASIENDQITKPFSLKELRTIVAKRAHPPEAAAAHE